MNTKGKGKLPKMQRRLGLSRDMLLKKLHMDEVGGMALMIANVRKVASDAKKVESFEKHAAQGEFCQVSVCARAICSFSSVLFIVFHVSLYSAISV